ncbi:similar to Saccharomyces cerevisiae YLR347C KAP95 Karyopherin beta, forms a complex with Srp1p/Kap60p [Maudiozyma saulgeensis]|uniref:Importin-95 n=1 Tax=Maudiozyma saulgeensis TaxID=1789683 RepID=A0A1X7RAG8_9SACH|nr:similar to Saccharomyces cerevisiae YLR347C KAP95 Karyopherin beta, forms a complex with Srp1p/Kap60p [Kazachstania saulgeensis]
MSTAEFTQLLENTILSPDANVRLESETQLKRFSNENFIQYAGLLSQVLIEENSRVEPRILAALNLKNELISKDSIKNQQFAQRWSQQVDVESRTQIKQNALAALTSNEPRVANASAQLIAAIADIELPQNEWQDLMKIMVDHTNPNQSENSRRAALLTIGYICESADPQSQALVSASNQILIAIAQCTQATEPSRTVRLAALNALADSLIFIKNNMERDGERNYLMQIVCEATQADDVEIQAASFGCLCKIMSLYYALMKPYMEQALYALTVATMESEDDKVASMTVEFWSTVCEEEIDIAYERSQFPESPLQSYNFALSSLKDVVPNLLKLLTRQNSDPEDDDWNVAMSAGACLQLYAQNCGDSILAPVLEFVEQNITSENWRNREAAVMAFGSIMDGPDKTQTTFYVHQALPAILNLMNDQTLQVKDTASWCIGRIADLVAMAIDPQQHLPGVVNACLTGLQDHPKVATNCSWTVINLIEQLTEEKPSPIYNYYPALVDGLMKCSNRPDNEFNARASAFAALTTMVEFSSDDVAETSASISTFVLDKLGQTMAVNEEQLSLEDAQSLQELQSNILTVLAAVIRKSPQSIQGVSDMLMDLFIKLLQKKDASFIEDDVFFAISALSMSLGKGFQKYLEAFSPFLVKALNQVESTVAITAVGFIADISNSLEEDFKQYAGSFMNVLGQILSNPSSRKELKPAILSVFGDIASNIGPEFVPYLQDVMALCVAAQNTKPENGTLDAMDYNTRVLESVLDAYVGIVGGLHDTPQAIYPYVGTIFQFISLIADDPQLYTEDSTARSAVGLIGDIASMISDGSIKQFYGQEAITDLIKKTRSNPSFSQATKDVARWARSQQKLQLSQ